MHAQKYLTTKVPNLAAAGSVVSDLYFNSENSSVEAVEATCNWMNKMTLSSKTFGANVQISLPSNAFLGQVLLRLKLPNVQLNETICRGWGLRMIKSIQYQMGASAVGPILMNQQAIWHTLMAQCDTEEKRSTLFNLCGEARTAAAVAVDPYASIEDLEAYVPIPLPFSTVCEKLMYDSSLIGQPITLQIQFEQDPRAIYGGSATHPTEFTYADLLIRQMALSDQGMSLRNVLNVTPEAMYSYPNVYVQGNEAAAPFAGSTDESTPCSIQLNQFLNSDLIGMVIAVQRVTDLTPTGTNAPNPFHVDRVKNVAITYNGGSVIQWPGYAYKAAASLMGNTGPSFFKGCYIMPSTNQCKETDEYLIFVDFSRLRAMCTLDHLTNEWRLPAGSILALYFNTDYGSSVQYRCFYTCFYNQVITSQQGVSNSYLS